MFEIFSKNQEEIWKKNNFGNIRKGYFVWRKEIFFERVRLTTAKRKKTKPEGEEKLNWFQREMKKENEKGDYKETQRSCKKKSRDKVFFF